jgi:Protein of unknown function (DUF1566)
MKTMFKLKLEILVIGMFALTCPLAHAQTSAPGPYYATPSWDQQLPTTTRFIVLSNWNSEAVLDRETGLVWQRSPSAESTSWTLRSVECISSKTGARYGWRLPAIHELASLLDTAPTSIPPLPAGHPFLNVPGGGFFWTANSSDDNPNNALLVVWLGTPSPPGFEVSLRQSAAKTFNARGWCVRGGLQSAPQ